MLSMFLLMEVIMDFLCVNCGSRGFYLQEKGPNVGLYCECCGKWSTWVRKKELPLYKRRGYSVLPMSAKVTLKNNLNLGVDISKDTAMNFGTVPFADATVAAPEPKADSMSFQEMETEIERRVAEKVRQIEESYKKVNMETKGSEDAIPSEQAGFCPVCDGNPLESEGNSRVEVSIFSGVMTITDPEGLNIYGLYKLKRCPYCGKLF